MYGPAPSRPEGALPSRCSAELVGHDGAVLNVRFNGSGAYILSCGKDRTVRLWSASRGALLKTYAGHGHEVRDVAVSPDNGRLATCGGDRQVFLWDVASGRTIRKFKGHDSAVNAVVFAANGDVVVSGGYDTSIRCFDCRSQSADAICVASPFKDSVTSLALAGDGGAVIVAGSVDGSVRQLDVRAGVITTDALGAPVTVVALSRDGGACILAACAGPSVLRLIDAAQGTLLAEYSGHVNASHRCGAGLNADDAHVACGSEDGRVVCWELVGGDIIGEWDAHGIGKTVCGLDWHPTEARSMATCGTDGLVKLWTR